MYSCETNRNRWHRRIHIAWNICGFIFAFGIFVVRAFPWVELLLHFIRLYIEFNFEFNFKFNFDFNFNLMIFQEFSRFIRMHKTNFQSIRICECESSSFNSIINCITCLGYRLFQMRGMSWLMFTENRLESLCSFLFCFHFFFLGGINTNSRHFFPEIVAVKVIHSFTLRVLE